MEALSATCAVSRGPFQDHRLVACASADRRGSVAKVRLCSATGPRLPWRTPSPSLLLPPLPQPLPPRSSRCCPCAALRNPPPHSPSGTGFSVQESPRARGTRGFAELRRWGAGRTGSGRGQRGKPGEPGQSVRGRSRGSQLRVPEFGCPLPGPSFPAGLPTRGRSPGGRPRR